MSGNMQMTEDEARKEVEAIAKIANMAFGGLADVAEAVKPSRWDRMTDAGDVTFDR